MNVLTLIIFFIVFCGRMRVVAAEANTEEDSNTENGAPEGTKSDVPADEEKRQETADQGPGSDDQTAQEPQDGANGPQPGLTSPEEGTSGPQVGLKSPQEGANGPQEGLEVPQAGPQGPQEGVNGPQEGLSIHEEGVEGPQEGQTNPTEAQNPKSDVPKVGLGSLVSPDNGMWLGAGTGPGYLSSRCRRHRDCGVGNMICAFTYCVPATPVGTTCSFDTDCPQSSIDQVTGCKGGMCLTAGGGSNNMWNNGQCTNGGSPLFQSGSIARCNPYTSSMQPQCPLGYTCDTRIRICCSEPGIPGSGLLGSLLGQGRPGGSFPNQFQGEFGYPSTGFNDATPDKDGKQAQKQGAKCPPNEVEDTQTCTWTANGPTRCPGNAYCGQNGACCIRQ